MVFLDWNWLRRWNQLAIPGLGILVKIILGDTNNNNISDSVWSPNRVAGIAEHLVCLISAKPCIHSMNWGLLYFNKSKMALICHTIIMLCTIKDKNAAKINSWHVLSYNDWCRHPDFRGVKVWKSKSVRPEEMLFISLEFRHLATNSSSAIY